MGLFASARDRLRFGGRTRQYRSIEDVKDLEAISDPTTLEDETQTTWREWAGENTVLVLAFSLLGMLILAFAWMQFARFAPSVYNNIWVRRGVALLLVAGLAYRSGHTHSREQIAALHRLDLNIGERVVPVLGRYVSTPGEADLFIPIKGLRRAGRTPVPYTVDDLAPAMSDLYSKRAAGINGDSAAIIRLHPSYTRVESTEYGTVVSVDTADLEADDQARISTLKTTIPDHDDEMLRSMAEQLESLAEELKHQKMMKEKFRTQRDDALALADKPVDERVDTFLEQHKEFIDVRHGRRSLTTDQETTADDWRGTGSLSGLGFAHNNGRSGRTDEEILADVEAEVSDDDE